MRSFYVLSSNIQSTNYKIIFKKTTKLCNLIKKTQQYPSQKKNPIRKRTGSRSIPGTDKTLTWWRNNCQLSAEKIFSSCLKRPTRFGGTFFNKTFSNLKTGIIEIVTLCGSSARTALECPRFFSSHASL